MLGAPRDLQDVVETLRAAGTPEARFAAVTNAVSDLGFDQINYGFFDPAAASRAEAKVLFLSTMDPGWLEYYDDRQLHLTDPHVAIVRRGNLIPYRWGDRQIEALRDKGPALAAAEQTREAGLRSALCVPMTAWFDPIRPIAGMTLGSSLSEAELARRIGDATPYLTTLAHIFHTLSLGALLREAAGAGMLSGRERECLTYLAAGLRPDRIAERLSLARVTVDLHLANARRRLKARTLAEAVAKAFVQGQITP